LSAVWYDIYTVRFVNVIVHLLRIMLDFSARVRNTRRIPYRKVVVGVDGNFGTDLDLSMIVGMVFHGESGRRVGALQQFDVLSHRKPITLEDSRSPKKVRFNGVEFRAVE